MASGTADAEPAPHRAGTEILARAMRTASRCGVTRLADITRLDRIGLPVWQAVRPAGRALSIHQGKGATPIAAKIGALCEAIESHYAEQAPADGPSCPADALPGGTEVPALADLACDRSRPPKRDAEIRWCRAVNLINGAPAWLPHDFVSLDFTRDWRSHFDRSSGGLGAGTTTTRATEKALLELLENDAVGRWERSDVLTRMNTVLSLDSIVPRWFQTWRTRLDVLGMGISLCALEAATGHPVIHCTLICSDRNMGAAIFAGAACHGSPETALFGALAEAIQSRLTFIAGARDDMLPSLYDPRTDTPPAIGPVPPPAPGMPMIDWQSVRASDCTLTDLLNALSRAGHNGVWSKTLSPADTEIHVVKAFVGGLGSLRRTEAGSSTPCA